MTSIYKKTAIVLYHRTGYEINASASRFWTAIFLITQYGRVADIQRKYAKKAHTHRMKCLQVTGDYKPNEFSCTCEGTVNGFNTFHKMGCPIATPFYYCVVPGCGKKATIEFDCYGNFEKNEKPTHCADCYDDLLINLPVKE